MVANVQAYIETIEEEKCLILRGFNPTNDFLKKVSAEEFVTKVFGHARKLASDLSLSAIYITESLDFWYADSNRSDVRKVLEKMYVDSEKIEHEMRITNNKSIRFVYRI